MPLNSAAFQQVALKLGQHSFQPEFTTTGSNVSVGIGVRVRQDKTRLLLLIRRAVIEPPGLAALDAEMSIGNVFWGDGLLVALRRVPLLLDLEVAEDGHEQEEDDEAHAAADDEAEASREEAVASATTGAAGVDGVAHGLATVVAVVGVDRLGQRRGPRAPTRGRVHHLLGHGLASLAGGALSACLLPIAQSDDAHEVARVWVQLGQLEGAGGGVQEFATDLRVDTNNVTLIKENFFLISDYWYD